MQSANFYPFSSYVLKLVATAYIYILYIIRSSFVLYKESCQLMFTSIKL